jgi:multiple sugar transport system permease protein
MARAMRSLKGKIAAFGLLGIWAVVCAFPLAWIAVTSLKDAGDIVAGPYFLPFVSFAPTLRAWVFILLDPHESMAMPLAHSAFVSLFSTLLSLAVGGGAVYGMTRFSSRSATLLRDSTLLISILATRLLPPVVVVLPLYFMARYSGLLDSDFALILTYTAINLPIAVWLLRPILGSKATEQEDAARLDGASHWLVLSSVVIPMAASGFFAAGLLVFFQCWNEYLFAAYLTSDHAMTVPPYLVGQMSIKEAQIGSEAEEWANFSAATIVASVPLLVCTALVQRFLGRIGVWRNS